MFTLSHRVVLNASYVHMQELCTLFGCKTDDVRKLIDEGQIKAIRKGGNWCVSVPEVLAFVERTQWVMRSLQDDDRISLATVPVEN